MASVISASTTSATALNMSADTTGVLQLATGATPTTAVTIDTSQNVGIGTTSPTTKLQVKDAGTPRFSIIDTTNNVETQLLSDDTAGYIGTQTNHPMIFVSNVSERMRIDSSGNVGIGTTPKSWGLLVPIQMQNAAFASNGVIAYVIGNAYYNGSAWKRIVSGYASRVDASADNGQVLTWTSGTSTADSNITWTQGPYVANLGTSWTNSSDERLKNITGEITNAIDKVSQIRAAEFTWKSDESNKPQVGLIAQDLQKVLPEVVVVPEKEFDGSSETALGVNYDQVIPLLVAAIKEQQTIINDLKARVTALEAK